MPPGVEAVTLGVVGAKNGERVPLLASLLLLDLLLVEGAIVLNIRGQERVLGSPRCCIYCNIGNESAGTVDTHVRARISNFLRENHESAGQATSCFTMECVQQQVSSFKVDEVI